MRRRLAGMVGLGLGIVGVSAGCAAVALVGVGSVVGYAVSRDHVEMTVEQPYDKVWSAALEETKRTGLLKDINQDIGRIEATAQGTHLVVTLERLTETTVKVIIKARKHMLPQIETAQRLATRLAKRLG